MRIEVKEQNTFAVEMNEDGEFVCPHYDIEMEDNSFDYAGTHATYGQSGTHTQINAVCADCDEDLSETFDWDGYYQDQAEAGLDL